MSEHPNGQHTHTKIKIQGHIFSVTQPYHAGHSLTEKEAQALNQLRCENLRNNFAKTVDAAKEEAGVEELSAEKVAELQAMLAEKDAAYAFQGRVAGVASVVDPVEKIARQIARDIIKQALKAKNMDIKTLPEGKMDELIANAISKRPDITAEAQRRVHATKAVAEEALADLV